MSYPWHESHYKALMTRRGRLPHALLIRGPQGIGKLAFAEAVARSLLCEQPGPDGAYCGHCTACGWTGQGGHPDWRRLEPEALAGAGEGEPAGERKEKSSTQITVDQVRGIADFINVTSHRGGLRVVLIHPVEALNVHAANALLKNLEEPPPGVHFLLVTHRWHRLLPTVRSRCQHVALASPPPDAARNWLSAQGMRDPVLALAHAGNAPLLAATFDEDYWRGRDAFLKTIGGRFDALALAERIRDEAPARVVGWMQKWAYDLVARRATGKVTYNPDFEAAIAVLAARIAPTEAARFLRRVVELQRIVQHPLNARLFFEELLLAYAALVRGGRLERAA